MPNLAGSDQLLDRAGYLLDRHVRIDTMLIEQVDGFDFQPRETAVGDLLDVFRSTVEGTPTLLTLRCGPPAKLGGDHDLTFERRERLADDFLINQRSVHFGRVKEGDSLLDRRTDHGNGFLLVLGPAITLAETHRSKSDGGDFESAASENSLLHS